MVECPLIGELLEDRSWPIAVIESWNTEIPQSLRSSRRGSASVLSLFELMEPVAATFRAVVKHTGQTRLCRLDQRTHDLFIARGDLLDDRAVAGDPNQNPSAQLFLSRRTSIFSMRLKRLILLG